MEASPFKNKCRRIFSNFLVALAFCMCNIATADETIIIVGDPIEPPHPKPIVILNPGTGGGGGGGEPGIGGGGGGTPPQTKEECEEQADEVTNQCVSLYAWNYTTATVFCARLGGLNVFLAVGCQKYLNDTNNNAIQWCKDQGAKLKEQCQ